MDTVLFVYSVFLAGILLFPFVYFQMKKHPINEDRESFRLKLERSMLLENLRDLKTDFETGKFSVTDFQNLSRDIISKLQKIDELHPYLIQKANCDCGEKKISSNSKFCHICGKKF